MISKKPLIRLWITCIFLTLSIVTSAQSVFINEIHYDNTGADSDEGIEIAGPASTDLNNWSLVLYNGNNGASYTEVQLTEVLLDSGNGFGFLFVPITGIQNGAPDGIALVNASSEVVQFLSYEGSFTAVGGPADGIVSEDIGVAEDSGTATGLSLQLSGEGMEYQDFVWETPTLASYDAINTNQIFGTPVENVFINEIHYDNAGGDTGEGIELAGEANIDLTGWSLVFYNGSNGSSYNTETLSGPIPDAGNGFGFVSVAISGIQNGGPDGVALVNAAGEVVQFLSYEGSFTAVGGPADGITSEDIGVFEASNTPVGQSLQLTGEGTTYVDFTWAAPAAETFGAVNENQVLGNPVEIVFINEFHYDNAGSDEGEAIELAGSAGTDLSGWSLVLYNGNGGVVYNTTPLSGVFENATAGFGFISVPFGSIQNGAPDGFALVDDLGEVVQFLSYEGTFIATDGPASGLESQDIGISEGGGSPIGSSLQLVGTGTIFEDFTWSSLPNTFGALNTGQSFGGVDPVDPELVSIAEARSAAQGTTVKIQGVLTASDQLGGPAYIQDASAGIPVFDETVHGAGLFNIGDELEIVATVGQFNEQIQLGSVTSVTLVSSNNEVTPVVTTLDQLANFEGQLVFIDAITFDIPGRLFVGNHTVSDATGSADIRIDNTVESLIGRIKPEGVTTLTGVVGSFRGAFQVFPRFEPDLPGTEEFIEEPPAGGDIPRNETLDIASWNVEFFGATLSGFGPSDIQLQKENVLRVLDSLQADIIALQEVSDVEFLANAISEATTENFGVICSDVYSRSFEPDDGTFPPQQLCFIYNKNVVKILDEQVIFDEFYTAARTGQISDLDDYPTGSAQSFWSSGRLPYRIEAEITINGVVDTLSIVNVHGKSGSAPEDVARKEYDYRVLKDTLDTYFGNEKLVLLGDYNDDVDISIGGGTTPLEPFVTDTTYDIVSNSFSFEGLSSTVFGNAVIDHIAITNELFDPYIEDSEDLLNPQDFITDYESTTSDHFPVETRFLYEIQADPLLVSLEESILLYEGYEKGSTSVITPEVTGGVPPYSFLWSTGATTPSLEITSDDEGVVTVSITDANGTIAEATIEIVVEDVSCQKGWFTGVQMCYKGKSVCIPQRWVSHFKSKGFVLGSCAASTIKREVKATPNPFRDRLRLLFDFDSSTEVVVQVTNFFGHIVFEQEFAVETGKSEQTMELSNLPWGIYVVRIIDKNDADYLKKILVYKRL